MKISVVIVEDDPMVADIHSKYVSSLAGFTVITVLENGQDAIDYLLEHDVDLVILDIFMPVKNGIDVLNTIKTEQLPVDVITITAAKEHDTVNTCLRSGVFDYILKPFAFSRLEQALQNYQQKFIARQNIGEKYQQQQIDLMLNFAAEEATLELPKGIQEFTLKKICTTLKSSTVPLSAAEAANQSGISRVTARRYLEYLLEISRVTLEPQYAPVGRPVNRYRYR